MPEAARVEKRITDAGGVVASKCDKNFGSKMTKTSLTFFLSETTLTIFVCVCIVTGVDASLCDIAGRVVYNPAQPDFTSYQTIAATASVCSPIVAQLAQVVPMLKPFASKLGPCGEFCRDAACGLNILCATQASSVISFINSQPCPANVTALDCASFGGGDTNSGGTDNTSPTKSMMVPDTVAPTDAPTSTPDVAVAGISLTPADYAKCASLSDTSCKQCTADNAICMWCESTKSCNATTTAWLGPSQSIDVIFLFFFRSIF